VAGSGDEARPIQLEDACIIDRAGAALVKEPVDIVLVLDNSGSMADELAAVEQNINVNFAAILADSGIDYRVILISRHRRDVRDEAGESSTSICVSSPLSAAIDCDDQGRPAFSEHFFHYSVKIESNNSFDVLLDTFAPPFDNSGREDKFHQAPDGWSAWLRPSAKKVFLEMTDDAAEMASATFVEQLTALSPAAFGSPEAPRFVFHSIVGVVEKEPPTAPYLPEEPIVSERCEGNASDVENAGEPYQELSRLTRGLRFPLCQFDGFDVVFRSIAEDVVVTNGVACDFAIPTPPAGQALNLDQLAVSLARGDGSGALQLGQTTSLAECQAGAFYIAGDRINLCPAACEAVRSDPSSDVEVLFTCRSTFLPR
ncbi:MAG: hypothetical protein ABW217_12760, partial [Polyangiaceae bacterium]